MWQMGAVVPATYRKRIYLSLNAELILKNKVKNSKCTERPEFPESTGFQKSKYVLPKYSLFFHCKTLA